MPSTVNGIGTWYYGKKNYSRRQGVCKFCRKGAWLESYDTRLYFVVVFIPVIPLKRVHVMDQCSACRRHSVVQGNNWDTLQARANEAVEAANRSPRDEKMAMDVLGACVALRDSARFEKIGPEYEKRFENSPKMLAALAEACSQFGDIQTAERILRTAVSKTDEPEPHEALGRILMRTKRPVEAQPHLQHIIDDIIPDRIDDIYELGQCYQRAGQHREAMEMFDACRRIFPQIEQDKTYQKLRAASESLINTNKPVDSGKMLKAERNRTKGKRFLKIGAAVLVLLGIGYFAWALIKGYHANVFLVNGLGREYSVVVNGTSYQLHGFEAKSIHVPEGDVRIESPDLSGMTPATVKLSSSLLTRPFDEDVFVINPDCGAVLIEAEVVYGGGAQPGRPTLSVAQPARQFRGVDYPFAPPPRSIEAEVGSVVRKKHLEVLQRVRALSPDVLVEGLRGRMSDTEIANLVKAHASFDHDSEEYLGQLAELISPQELLSYLQAELPQRSNSVPWNRMYLHTMSRLGREEDAAKQYQAKLDSDPSNRLFQLMVALTEHHPARYLELLTKSAAEPGAPIEAHARLAGYYMCIGEYRLACAESDVAMEKMSADLETRVNAFMAYVGDGQLEKALKLMTEDQNAPPPRNFGAIREAAWILNKLGRKPEEAELENTLHNMVKSFESQDQQTATQQFVGNVAYAGGDATSYINSLRQSNDAEDRFCADLTAGEIAKAKNELGAIAAQVGGRHDADSVWFNNALLYIAAAKSNPAIAKPALEALIQKLQAGDFEDRAYAAALQGNMEMPDEELTHLRDSPFHRRILLTAIGLSNPARAKACFDMARKVNVHPMFPKLLIDNAISQASTAN